MNYGDFEKTIELVHFPDNQYYKRAEPKTQIVIHHTVSGDGVDGDIAWWLSTKDRIATHFIISRNGKIRQNFSTEFWAHHLGVTHGMFEELGLEPGGKNSWLNMRSVSIELDSWGGLKDDSDIKKKKVKDFVKYDGGHRGYTYFETYTKEQLESLKKLLVYLCHKYDIPTEYKEDMWGVSVNALRGESGIWGHVSFRKDKSDPHPQPTLIETLKSINNETTL